MFLKNTVIFRIHNWHVWSVILKFSQQCFWGSWTLVGVLSVYVHYEGKIPHFFNLFLVLHSERGLSPESCLAIWHPRATFL